MIQPRFVPRSTVIGLKCKDGVVLAVEKLIISKLLVEGSNKRIYSVDKHAGLVSRAVRAAICTSPMQRACLDPSLPMHAGLRRPGA